MTRRDVITVLLAFVITLVTATVILGGIAMFARAR